MVDHGILPLAVEMLNSGDVEEQVVAGRALWNLAFQKDIADQMMVEYY